MNFLDEWLNGNKKDKGKIPPIPPWQFQPNKFDYYPGLAQNNPWLMGFHRPTPQENLAFRQMRMPPQPISNWGKVIQNKKTGGGKNNKDGNSQTDTNGFNWDWLEGGR